MPSGVDQRAARRGRRPSRGPRARRATSGRRRRPTSSRSRQRAEDLAQGRQRPAQQREDVLAAHALPDRRRHRDARARRSARAGRRGARRRIQPVGPVEAAARVLDHEAAVGQPLEGHRRRSSRPAAAGAGARAPGRRLDCAHARGRHQVVAAEERPVLGDVRVVAAGVAQVVDAEGVVERAAGRAAAARSRGRPRRSTTPSPRKSRVALGIDREAHRARARLGAGPIRTRSSRGRCARSATRRAS